MYFFKYPTCRLRIGGVAGATERTDGVVDHLMTRPNKSLQIFRLILG